MAIPRRFRIPAASCGAALLALHVSVSAAEPITFDIAPGKFDEHCLRIDAGQAIRWRFTASGALQFNIHHHRGEQVFYPVRRERARRASGSFRAREADDYCLMWSNHGPGPVTLQGNVERWS